jgi:hypothetical protein
MMIAARSTRLPLAGMAGGARAQVSGARLVETAAADAKLGSYRCGRKPACTSLFEEMADERRSEAAGQLRFFIALLVAGGWILRIPADAGQG